MVYKTFTSEDGDELTTYINSQDKVYILISNPEYDESASSIVLNTNDTQELINELQSLLNNLNG